MMEGEAPRPFEDLIFPPSSDPSAPLITQDDKKSRLERIQLLEKKIELQNGLPFLHAFPWYKWSREFFDSTAKMNLLTAANQSGKSVTQIRKCIDWATNVDKWPLLWNTKPQQFWYFYPSAEMVQVEFETKWKTLLPTGKYQFDEYLENGKRNPYRWKQLHFQGKLSGISFLETGVLVYFKTYSQKVTNLQASTLHSIFADEEVPVDYYDEFIFRLTATNGYFHTVFTATLGQEFWRKAMEPETHEDINLPKAKKWTVSLYDCMKFMDGTSSHWTTERIEEVIASCSTHEEVLRRVHGRFVRDLTGRVYPQFNLKINFGPSPPKTVPKDWLIYAAADTGSGGTRVGKRKGGHPSALIYLAIRPDYKFGRVFRAWRGDGVPTTSSDVVNKHIEIMDDAQIRNRLVTAWYDFANKDFEMTAMRMGHTFLPADKNHARGESLLNLLFKHKMLELDSSDAEIYKLGVELSALRNDKPKNIQEDDLADSTRYAVIGVPWDLSDLPIDVANSVESAKRQSNLSPEEEYVKMRFEWRKNGIPPEDPGRIQDAQDTFEEEAAEDNEQLDPNY